MNRVTKFVLLRADCSWHYMFTITVVRAWFSTECKRTSYAIRPCVTLHIISSTFLDVRC